MSAKLPENKENDFHLFFPPSTQNASNENYIRSDETSDSLHHFAGMCFSRTDDPPRLCCHFGCPHIVY